MSAGAASSAGDPLAGDALSSAANSSGSSPEQASAHGDPASDPGNDPGSSPESQPDRAKRSQHLRAVLQVTVAVVLLAFVARTVPWSDQLVYHASDGEQLVLPGEIVGDWKDKAIQFTPAETAQPGSGLPAPFAERLGSDGRLSVQSEPSAREEQRAYFTWRPGMPRVFRDLDPKGLALAFCAFSIGQLSGITRWWRLLAIAGVVTTWWNAFRLTFLGLFFNLVVPGGVTGGDVVKSVIVARENPERRTHAFVSVYVDRIIGLLVLALFTAVIVLVQGNVFAALRVPVLLFLAAAVLGFTIYANQSLRRLIRFDQWIDKVPMGGMVRKLDEAALVYSGHPLGLALAALLSLVNHTAVIFGCLALGRAFGDLMPTGHYFAAVPIANTISALPLSPGGWGIGEAAFGTLFELVGGTATIGVAVSVTFRLAMMIFGLFGGLFLLIPSSGLSWKQIEELEQSAPEASPH